MSFKTVKQISNELDYTSIPGWSGTPLEFKYFTREEVSNLKIDNEYQRLISKKKLAQYGQLNFNLLIPSVISCRPKNLEDDYSGNYIIDGQHKAEKYYKSRHSGDGITSGFPCIVMYHDENSSYQEVRENEAKLFEALNTNRKKLTKIDELRAQSFYGDQFAVHVESVMKLLNIVIDGFGSDDKNAREMSSFSHFYYAVDADYKHNSHGAQKMKVGYDLWKEVFKNVKDFEKLKVHGTALRAMFFLDRFIKEGLSNGKQDKFYTWCVKELSKQYSQDTLVKPFTSFDSPRQVLHRVIEKYNSCETCLNGRAAQTIGPKTLLSAIEATSEFRFEHPNEDEMNKILKDAADRGYDIQKYKEMRENWNKKK